MCVGKRRRLSKKRRILRERGILREIRKKRKIISCLRCIQGPYNRWGPHAIYILNRRYSFEKRGVKCGTCGGEGVCEYVVGKIEEGKKNEGT